MAEISYVSKFDDLPLEIKNLYQTEPTVHAAVSMYLQYEAMTVEGLLLFIIMSIVHEKNGYKDKMMNMLKIGRF